MGCLSSLLRHRVRRWMNHCMAIATPNLRLSFQPQDVADLQMVLTYWTHSMGP